MKTIGLLGGMSWESTAVYYRSLNEKVKARLGGLHSARVLLHSVDFAPIAELQAAGKWDEAGAVLAGAAKGLEAAGADIMLIGTNTMHLVAPQVADAVTIPLLHIADATAEAIKPMGIQKVGLLGTRFTMEKDFYKGHLRDHHGIETLVPDADDRDVIHRIIYEELCLGVVKEQSRDTYLTIIGKLKDAGAECIILGCTEICLLIEQQHISLPLFDTTSLHAEAAVNFAINP
ncbi:aspartate/glutamate racemase family protein [Kordiimonas gwangyangensis]|uniref:aspartate/glutamate racemase family protein n=1 Tax=Kordiimonas gwangyangensis TaxID=288022 RepID=UPI000380695C|nr:aspartate/glutamate racemase family protein [Kordiimonas gwangyangensis]